MEKKTDDEGNTTYILKKEETSTDENGNTVTRVTYYKITGTYGRDHAPRPRWCSRWKRAPLMLIMRI